MNEAEIIHRYLTAYGRLRAATARQVAALWVRFGGLDDAQADRFIAAAVPLVEGAQTATARLVAAYWATLARAAVGGTVEAAIPPAAVTGLRGVDPADVYRRPTLLARYLMSEGKPAAEALLLARRRAATLAETDVVMAQRAATLQIVDADQRIVGYRRVLTGMSCAFCAAASTQRYHRQQLMPIHTRCDCGTAPIFAAADPGQVINRPLVDSLKAAAKTGNQRRGYWEQRHVTVDADGNVTLPEIAVHRHGELGPVLGAADHDFTSLADLAA